MVAIGISGDDCLFRGRCTFRIHGDRDIRADQVRPDPELCLKLGV
jgi:hypothetical protein